MSLSSLKAISYFKVSEYKFLILRYSDNRVRVCYTYDGSFDWRISSEYNNLNITRALEQVFGPFIEPGHIFFWMYVKIIVNKNLQVIKPTKENVKKFNLSKILKEDVFYIESKPLTSKMHSI